MRRERERERSVCFVLFFGFFFVINCDCSCIPGIYEGSFFVCLCKVCGLCVCVFFMVLQMVAQAFMGMYILGI